MFFCFFVFADLLQDRKRLLVKTEIFETLHFIRNTHARASRV